MYVYYDYDVRILTMCSCDVRIFQRRTSSTDVRIICYVRIYDVCHSATYVLFRRTYATDVRIHARTSLREIQIRDYTVEIRSRDYAGLRSRDQNSGLRRTLRI